MEEPENGKRTQLGWIVYAIISLANLVYTTAATTDRYTSDRATSELGIRDARITHLTQQNKDLKEDIRRIDQNGPAVGNRAYSRTLSDHETRLRALE